MQHTVSGQRGRAARAAWFALALIASSIAAAGAVRAQDPTTPPPVALQEGPPLDLAAVSALRAAVEGDASLTDDVKKSALDALDKAREELSAEATWTQKRRELQATIDGARAEIDTIAAKIAAPRAEPQLTVTEISPLADVEAALSAKLLDKRTKADALERNEQKRLELEKLQPGLSKTLFDANAERTEVQRLIVAAAPEGENAVLTQVRQFQLRARGQRILAFIAERDLVQRTLDTQFQLLRARRSELTHDTALVDAYIERLQQVATVARRAAINPLEQQVRQELARAKGPMKVVAQQNLELVDAQLAALDRREGVSRLRAEIERERTLLDAEFSDAQRRVKQIGRTETVGLELRQLRNSRLRAIATLRRDNRDLSELQVAAFETRYDHEDRLEELSDPEAAAAAMFDQLSIPDDERAALSAAMLARLATQRAVLAPLVDAYGALTTDYSQAYAELRLLLAHASEAEAFIDELVLWIPSTRPVWSANPAHFATAARGLVDTFRDGVRSIWSNARDNAVGTILAGIALLVMLLTRRLLIRRLATHATAARHRTTVAFAPTLKALADTVLLALWLPLVFVTAGLLAGTEPEALPFRTALFDAALMLSALTMIHELSRRNGLGEAHFDWPAAPLRNLRRSVRWLAPLLVVFSFGTTTLVAQGAKAGQGELARSLLLPPLIGLAIALAQLLRPTGDMLRAESGKQRVAQRARVGLFLLGIGVPIGLTLLALLGYAFTAIELYTRLNQTLVLALAVVLGTSLVIRWLLLSRREFAIEQARERRRLLKEQGKETSAEPEQQVVDLAAVDQQTRKLIRAASILVLVLGVWAIWVDVLPALGMLREVELWDEVVQVTVTETATDGTEQISTVERVAPITLASLLLAAIILIATTVLSRNVGGLLEIVLLRRLRVQAGERYAITTLTRYVIVALGVLFAFGSIGLGWSKIQWLIAAVSVGLGFGLQEIFANFVSGLILLFERPIRVGDLVTVGDVDGRVARIQMRATTIVDFDRKELVVPNREFITSRFVNWSLTNPITRIVVKVGVAYGSDTARAQTLLLECARKCKTVLRDPEPNTVFRGFGDSTLDLELRVFIASMDDWIDAMNEVHRTVDETFKANGIEIAFPQRDLHIRSATGVDGSFASVEPRPAAAQPDDPRPAPTPLPRSVEQPVGNP